MNTERFAYLFKELGPAQNEIYKAFEDYWEVVLQFCECLKDDHPDLIPVVRGRKVVIAHASDFPSEAAANNAREDAEKWLSEQIARSRRNTSD